MIRVKNTSESQRWASEKYLKESDRIHKAYKRRRFKKFKALIMGKVEEPSKPTE